LTSVPGWAWAAVVCVIFGLLAIDLLASRRAAMSRAVLISAAWVGAGSWWPSSRGRGRAGHAQQTPHDRPRRSPGPSPRIADGRTGCGAGPRMIDLSQLAVASPVSYLTAFLVPALDAITLVLPSETIVVALGVATVGSLGRPRTTLTQGVRRLTVAR
jgi:hypothetical protein